MLLLGCLMMASQASAATGRVLKVLPHLLDTNGLHTLKPSLYERDAYQAYLRKHPDDRWQHMSDVKHLLEDLARDDEWPGVPSPAKAALLPHARRPRARRTGLSHPGAPFHFG